MQIPGFPLHDDQKTSVWGTRYPVFALRTDRMESMDCLEPVWAFLCWSLNCCCLMGQLDYCCQLFKTAPNRQPDQSLNPNCTEPLYSPYNPRPYKPSYPQVLIPNTEAISARRRPETSMASRGTVRPAHPLHRVIWASAAGFGSLEGTGNGTSSAGAYSLIGWPMVYVTCVLPYCNSLVAFYCQNPRGLRFAATAEDEVP